MLIYSIFFQSRFNLFTHFYVYKENSIDKYKNKFNKKRLTYKTLLLMYMKFRTNQALLKCGNTAKRQGFETCNKSLKWQTSDSSSELDRAKTH